MPSYEELLRLCQRLEEENPGKTIVLSLQTGEPVVISDDPAEILEKAGSLLKEGIPILYFGGPNINSEMPGMHGLGCSVESIPLDNYE